MNSTPAITVSGLGKRFGSVTAVDQLSFDVKPGEIFGLVGPDGAGKTTTMRMLAGVLTPDSGSATVAGHDVLLDPEGAKRDLSYMPQRFGLYEDLTVDENIRFYADLFGVRRKEREERSAELLAAAGFAEFRRRLAGNLSGGMKQKLGLVCALIHTPRVILLDEPTNGVDPVSRRDFWAILYQLVRDGLTVFVTTAYLDEAERCNRVGLMNQGRMIRCESPRALKLTLEETCYEIETADQRAARAFLQHEPGVLAVEPYGAKLHLYLSPGGSSPEALEKALAAHEIPASSFREIVPSLEDVFIGLIRKEGKSNAA